MTPASTSTIAPERERLLDEIKVRLADLAAQSPTATPGLTLTLIQCGRLEETLGIGATRSFEQLVKAVERLAAIKVGEIKLPFTPGQLTELKHRAEKRGRTIEQEMKAVVDRIRDELFYKGG